MGRSHGPGGDEPSDALNTLSNRVIGAALEVHRVLGPGFLESVYEEALARELELKGIPFASQQPVAVTYKGKQVGEGRIDLLVADSLVVELKAVESLLPVHTVQLHSYLKATGLKLGLLINFNVPLLRDGVRRVILKTLQ
ncbi:MAG TPA: GxxExxY protein [Chloroflexia bacterium]|nr:GxxExxY protein [Chloroflexia bacterium]